MACRKFMIRKNPLDIEPKPVDVEPRPLIIKEVREKAYPKV